MSVDVRATAGGAKAAIEDRWFRELCDAIEEFLKLEVQHRDAAKSDRESLGLRVHEAKAEIVARFYAQGMGAL